MLYVIISILISLIFLGEVCLAGNVEPSVKTEKVTGKIKKLLLFVPVLVAVIFAVLFCSVLKGRWVERSSHALIVLCLWLYGTAFYVSVLKFFKNKNILIISVIGMLVSVALAITLTPLNRYCASMFTSIHELAFVLGVAMLSIWYFVLLKKL